LIKLDLSGCIIYDDDLRILAEGLSDNKSLKDLNLREIVHDVDRPTLEAIGWRALSFKRPNCILETLDLSDNYIDGESITGLSFALVNMTAVKNLHLGCNFHGVGIEGWQELSIAIGQNFTVEKLSLTLDTITDEGVAILMEELGKCSALKKLNLWFPPSVTKAGLMEVVTLLLNPESVLEELCLLKGANLHIDDEVAVAVANASRGNETLKDLYFGGDGQRNITAVGWREFVRSLCDVSSMNSIRESNHTLERLAFRGVEQLPHNLALLLKMNAVGNKILVAGTKIISLLKLEHIMDMEVKVLPRAISWIGNKHRGQISRRYSRLYELIRNKPSLFDHCNR
jgi:hypothetical protein